MTDISAVSEVGPRRWPFAPRDSFSGLAHHHRMSLIHSLPGILVWPLIMIALTSTLGGFGIALWDMLGGPVTGWSAATAFFVSATLGYAVTAALMAFWFSRYEVHGAAFSIMPQRLSDFGIAFLAMVFVIGFGSPLTIMFHEFAMSNPELTLSGGADQSELSNVDNITEAGATTWSMILFAVIAAPIVEEVLFRGWMLPMLRARGVPVIFAILISALAFGLVHIFHDPNERLMVMTSTFFLGLALGVARVVTGRTAAPVLGHMANNAWAIFVIPKLIELQSA
jgi:membrane protease YdiL (CAAX protease family)